MKVSDEGLEVDNASHKHRIYSYKGVASVMKTKTIFGTPFQ